MDPTTNADAQLIYAGGVTRNGSARMAAADDLTTIAMPRA